MITSPLLASAMFAAVTVLLFLLPFLPCWREWQSPTDLAALVIVRDEVNNVHYFANAFREQVSRACGHGNAMAAADPQFQRTSGPADTFPWDSVQQPVIVDGSLRVGGLLACPKPVYSSGDTVLPGGAHLSALLCKGNAAFGPDTRICEWAHADGAVSLGPGSIVLHRVTAGGALMLGKGAGFCRMHAPVIRFGANKDRAAKPLSGMHRLSPAWPGLQLVACGAGRYRADGDVQLPVNHYLEGTLIAGGTIRLDDGAAVFGAVKARRSVHLGRGAQIHGALVCEGDIDIGPDCWIKGPIVCEGDVRVACGSRIGTRQMPTTLAASRVLAETGVTAHGTVWARSAGVVAA
jgi:cytoskeletal protein CcmA (bactofilin family)